MKILVAPLNWGLGHATRCIPIIRNLIADGHEVVIVADGAPLFLLKETFPNLRTLLLPSYGIRYNSGNSQVTAMWRSLPLIFAGILREHHWLQQLLKQEHFDSIISDNRFGLWNKHIESTYITHQLMIKMPKGLGFAEPLVWLGHRWFILRYDHCWIPDHPGDNNLSGDLSHRYPLPRNAQFIGPKSRFSSLNLANISPPSNPYRTIALVSGPEPQRTRFEQELRLLLKHEEGSSLIVQGLPGEIGQQSAVNIHQPMPHLLPHMQAEELAKELLAAERIICRSGYSTIMDLEALGVLHKAIMIPTPGQTEQEYLAEYLKNKTAGV